MIYGSQILENKNIITEDTLMANIINESMDMYYNITKRYIDIVWESKLESINESFKDKIKTVMGFIKKIITKLKDMFVNFLKINISIVGIILSYIPPLFRYSVPVSPTIIKFNDNVDKMLSKVPKTLMDDIYKYYNLSLKDLRKSYCKDDGNSVDLDKIKEKYKNMALDIIKPMQPGLSSIDEINIYKMVSKEQGGAPEPLSVFVGELKLRVLDLEKRIKKTNKLGEELCTSYNSDISKIDSMMYKEANKDSNKEYVEKEALILDIIKAEYVGLIYTASLVGKTQFNILNYALTEYKTAIMALTSLMKSDKMKSRGASKKAYEEERKQRKGRY